MPRAAAARFPHTGRPSWTTPTECGLLEGVADPGSLPARDPPPNSSHGLLPSPQAETPQEAGVLPCLPSAPPSSVVHVWAPHQDSPKHGGSGDSVTQDF